MSYLVFARKYRPQTFGDMAGQSHVVRTIGNALKSGQLAHAFLFTGPRGVGKTTAARLVAKAVNCEKGPTAEPCGACSPCVEIAEGRAVDVVEIDAASNNGVDNIRDIVEAVKYRPARDRYKVFVVDEVHMLSQGAFNALLKTLEEPPEHVKFVLATTDVHKVPETIVSRCQRFDFRRLSLPEIVAQMKKVTEAEKMSLSDSALGVIARAAEGGMRDALSLLDQVRSACGDTASDTAVAEAIGAIDPAAVTRMASALIARNGGQVLQEVESLYMRGHEMKRVGEELTRHLRNIVVAKLAPQTPLDLPDNEHKEVMAQAAAAAGAQLARLFDLVQKAVADIKLSEQPRYVLEVALLKGCFLAPGGDIRELLDKADAMASGAVPSSGQSAKAAPAPAPAASAPATSASAPASKAASAPVSVTRVPQATITSSGIAPFGTPGCADPSGCDDPTLSTIERWKAAVVAVESVSSMAAPALKQCVLLWIREGEIAIQFSPESTYASTIERKRADIESAFLSHFGKPMRLRIDQNGAPAPTAGNESAPVSIAGEEQARRDARSKEVRQTAGKNVNITDAVNILGGEIARIEEL